MGKILAFLGDPSEAFSKRRVFDLEELIRTLIAGQEDSIFLVGNETLFDKDVSTAVQNIRKTGCEKFRLCLVLAKHLEGDLLDEYKNLGFDFIFMPEEVALEKEEKRILARNLWMADKADMLVACDYMLHENIRKAINYAEAQKKLIVTVNERYCF